MSAPEIYHYKEGNGLRFLVPLDDYEKLNEARNECERQFQTKQEELNDARAELAHWKANHDNQVKIKSTLIERPDLGDRASKIQKLIEENAAMREAIGEAHTALSQLDECRIFCADSMDIDSYVTDDCATARAKLQPLLKT